MKLVCTLSLLLTFAATSIASGEIIVKQGYQIRYLVAYAVVTDEQRDNYAAQFPQGNWLAFNQQFIADYDELNMLYAGDPIVGYPAINPHIGQVLAGWDDGLMTRLRVAGAARGLSAASGDYKKIPANSYRYEPNKSRLHVNAGGGNPGLHQILVGARNSGFILTGRSWVEIRNVTVTRAQQRGIVIQGGSSNLTLRGNTVTLCLGNGVHLDGGAGHVLAANTVSDNGDHGILVGGGATGCRIEDNESFRNLYLASKRANGIHSTGSSSNRYERNRLHDNQDSGLQLQSGSNNNFSIQNIVWLNGDHGFHDSNATGNAHIGDVASANVTDGFSLDANATGTRIVNCIAVNNGATTGRFNLRLDSGSATGFSTWY